MVGKQLNIVMLPWFAFGHMTPFLHLSNKLAENGHKITLFLPNKAKTQLDPLNLHPSLITLHSITVPHVDPLPPGTQTATDIPYHLHTHLITAMDLTRPEFESVVSGLHPDVIIHDSFPYWAADIAGSLGVKSVCYNVVCAAALALAMVPARKVPVDRPATEEDMASPPPGYPSAAVVLEPKRMLYVSLPTGAGHTMYTRITAGLRSCDAIAVRTCREVEGKFCDYLAGQYNKPILLTGPVLPEPEAGHHLEPRWAEWLGRFGPGSVVFCAFGSQSNLEKAQFQELLLGFEMTKLPFMMAVSVPPKGCETVEEAVPEGFRERVGNRGVVHGGWVQQPLIVAHPSVGCFVNHCGFGTMWESLMSHKQIVLVPQLGDQVLNAKVLAGELKVAVEVERGENGWVSKENLCQAIKCVMDEGNEIGDLVKKNHAKWRGVVGSQDFMSGYVDSFLKDLQALCTLI